MSPLSESVLGEKSRVVVSHLGSNGGGPKFALHLFKALHMQGSFDVGYVLSANSDQRERFAAYDCASFTIPTYTSKLGLILGLPRLFLHALILRAYLRRSSVEIVINAMESIYQGLMAPIAIPRNVRYVSCVHDADDHPGDAHWLKRLSRLGERWRADEFVTFSSTVRTALTAKRFVGNRAVHSSVHGVFGPLASRVRDNSSRADQTPVVGFLGRLGKYKGLDLLCESVGMLRADGFDVRGTIFGSGPESALAATALGKNCEWNIGWIKDEDIPSILDSFDVLALPYREASQSGVLAYALSRGVPVVSTPVGGLVEQISETSCGLVSRSVSPEDFAASLTQLLEDKRLQHDCASNALKAAQTTHAWSRVGDDFASWFSSKT